MFAAAWGWLEERCETPRTARGEGEDPRDPQADTRHDSRGDQAGALDRQGAGGDAGEAQREVERIIQQARKRHERLISDDEVTRQAERAAAEIIQDARRREREILLGAEDQADEILNTLGGNLSRFNTAVQRGRDGLAGTDTSAEIG